MKLVHYNSAYLEEGVLTQLISHTCSLATQPTSPSETEVARPLSTLCETVPPSLPLQLCLSFLDAVICYAVFPPQTILCCVVTLCHTLNIERFIQRSLEVGVAWGGCGSTQLCVQVMQRLLGTHLGHTVIYTMCSVLQDK